MRSWILLLASPAAAQFGFFDNLFQQAHTHNQQQATRGQNNLESLYHQTTCDRYLCEDTLACVDAPLDCPCPFEDSQLKCVLPDNSRYYCISKPSNTEGPACDFVIQAWENKI